MFAKIFNFFQNLIYVVLFIVFIPSFFFKIPKNGDRKTVVAIHGLLYSLAFVIIHIIFSSKRIALCSASGGVASV
jgi:hypothetical protein